MEIPPTTDFAARGRRWAVIGLAVLAIPLFWLMTWLGDRIVGERLFTGILAVLVTFSFAVIGFLSVSLSRALAAHRRDDARRARAEAVQQRLNRALRLLSACNMALVRADDERALLDEVCRLAVDKGGYRMAWVGYAEYGGDKMVKPISQSGFESGYLSKARIGWGDNERGRGPTGTAIRAGTTQVNQNVLTNPVMVPWRDAAARLGYNASIALPLSDDRTTFGALTIYSVTADAFNADEVSLLEELAGDLAFGITTIRSRRERAAAEEKLAFLSAHDALTHLPNRLLARDRFDQSVAAAQRNRTRVAILFLDIDHFKMINESLGTDLADLLLVRTAERLRSCVRDSDTISRKGGDEFIIQLPDIAELHVVEGIVDGILVAFAEPLDVGGTPVTISFSIGVSLAPDDGVDFEAVVTCANAATGEAKESGRNTYRFFKTTMNVDAMKNLRLRQQMPAALKNREFFLQFQPQIDIGYGGTVGVEALVRWQRPAAEPISPSQFIPLAEDNGFIIPLGDWVMNEACRQARAWEAEGMPPLVMAVNLSAVQFRRGDALDMVANALLRSGLPPNRLELELTESVLLQDAQETLVTLRALRDMGVKLSIDDFGTGYSSLSYLKRLPLDKLKIDQSFVRNVADDPESAAIVKAIIDLGHAMRVDVIAEGVETEAQLEILRGFGCDQAQGYWFSRPVAPDCLAAFLVSEPARSVEDEEI
jgi:diguanylate cyclase (GGDEF)-like protein